MTMSNDPLGGGATKKLRARMAGACLQCGEVCGPLVYGYGPSGDMPGASPFCSNQCLSLALASRKPDVEPAP